MENLFLFENHDQSYFIWKKTGFQNETLVHVDAHLDFDWIKNQGKPIHIGNYIWPAMEENIVKSFYWVVPDPIWEGKEQRLIKKDLAHNFKKNHPYPWRMESKKDWLRISWACPEHGRRGEKELIVLGFSNLPHFEEPVLLDIDVDFLITHSIFALKNKRNMQKRFPWIWPDTLAKILRQHFVWKVITIAYSVEGGYTPLSFKFLGDTLQALLGGQIADPKKREASLAWGLAEYYWVSGNKELSRGYHQRAIALDPSYKTEFNSDGIRLEILKRRKEALKEFEEIVECDPQDVKAKCNAANIHIFYKNFEKGRKLFEEALSYNAVCGEAHLGLGYLWMRQKKWEKAGLFFDQAIGQNVENKSVYYWKGLVSEKRGLKEEALNYYNQFVRMGRNNFWVSLRLAKLYLQKGATTKAKWEMERLLHVLLRTFKEFCVSLLWQWRKVLWSF